MVFQQKIEAQNLQQLAFGTSSAKSLTLSFYVKSNKTGTYEIMHFVSDGARQVNSTYTINSANTWEKKVLSIPADTGGTINNDNGEGWRSLFYLGRGSQRASGSTPTSWQAYNVGNEAPSQTVNIADNTANDWAITGYQLEVGSQATPFEHRSFGEELLLCKRYFEVYSPIASGNGSVGMTRTRTSVNHYQGLVNFHEKRAQPTATIDYDRLHKPGVVIDTLTTLSVGISTGETQSLTINVEPANNSTISTYAFLGKNSGTGSLKIDAEL